MKIKDIISKPSEAVQAMIDGIKEQKKRKGEFRIYMNYYGHVDAGICCGCAATCAVQKIAKRNYKPTEILKRKDRAKALNLDMQDLDRFENAIDYLRMGTKISLMQYFGYSYHELTIDMKSIELPYLSEAPTNEQLKPYQQFAKALKKAGL